MGGNHAAIHLGTHTLGDDRVKRAGQLFADGLAFFGREVFKDTTGGTRGVGGMHGGHHHVPRVRSVDRRLEGDRVAHLSHHDDVGILTQRAFQSALEGHRIKRDFTLFDHALILAEHEFDRIFQRDNMTAKVRVDVLQHGGHRGGFAATGGACQQDDAAL